MLRLTVVREIQIKTIMGSMNLQQNGKYYKARQCLMVLEDTET